MHLIDLRDEYVQDWKRNFSFVTAQLRWLFPSSTSVFVSSVLPDRNKTYIWRSVDDYDRVMSLNEAASEVILKMRSDWTFVDIENDIFGSYSDGALNGMFRDNIHLGKPATIDMIKHMFKLAKSLQIK